MHNTSNWGLTVPDETDEDDVPYWLNLIAAQIDATAMQIATSNIRYTRTFLLMGA